MNIAGIDPGLGGGVAVISDVGDCETILMPVTEDGAVDSLAVSQFLGERDVDFMVIEKTHSMPKQGVKSTFTFGYVSGQVRSIGQLMGTEPRLVTPQEWKKAWGLIKADKDASRDVAMMMFPRAYRQFTRVKDHGRAEAALIAAYHLNMHKRAVS